MSMQSLNLQFTSDATTLPPVDAFPIQESNAEHSGSVDDSPVTHSGEKTGFQTKPCNFIFPSRKKTAQIGSTTSRKSIIQDVPLPSSETLPLLFSPPGVESHFAHRQSVAADLSPQAPSFLDLDPSPRSEQFEGLPESASTGTFGGFNRNRAGSTISAITTSPLVEGFHNTGPRLSRTTPLSPLSQSFVPSRQPTANTEFSDVSNDSPVLSTPADILHPCLSKETSSPLTPDQDQTFITQARSSFFSISAYDREDNANTPMLDKAIDSRSCEYQRDSASLKDERVESVIDEIVEGATPIIIPTEATSSTLRRTRRPAPLNLNDSNNRTVPDSYRTSSRPSIEFYDRDTGSRKSSASHGPASPVIPAVEYVKTIQIELWIDQEEHRTIRPVFAFKRHTAQQGSRLRGNYLRPSTGRGEQSGSKERDKFWSHVTESGLVDMRMVAKEFGTFHCGNIAREATIRRLIVNGNDEKDYLSCNIVLPLKENGVYTAYGVENEKRSKGPARSFAWKFEYTVEDKRNVQTSQTGHGEKLLRPISFICSPELLAPSQASNVTIMHLLAKRLTPSPSATRIPPPLMPISTPASAAASDISILSEPSFLSTMKRKSKIGTAVKIVSRPTTPATDKRLRSGSESKRSSTGSGILSAGISFGRKDHVKPHTPHHGAGSLPPKSMSSFRGDVPRSSPILPPSLSKDSAIRQPNKPSRVSKSHFGVSLPRRPHTSETPTKRPHTTSHSIGRSVKHVGDALFGKVHSIKRPATAGHPQKASPLMADRNPFLVDPEQVGAGVFSHPVSWSMPIEEEISASLKIVSVFIRKEHQRLDILARSHNAKETTIERLDSSGELSTLDEAPFAPVQSLPLNLTGRPIASPRTLDHWTTSASLGTFKRPSTAHGTSHRSVSLADLKPGRPGTTDGTHPRQSPYNSQLSSRNPSTTSLGLPIPPRKPRTSSTKLP